MASVKKPSCLMVCSAHPLGVSAQSFIHSFTLTHSAFNVFVVTPEGKPIEFVSLDENSRRWLSEFKAKPFSVPGKLEDVEPLRYAALLIPSAMGSMHDLASHMELGKILNSFIEERKPICAVGYGVSALFSAQGKASKGWSFQDYSMTGPSIFEISQLSDFPEFPVIIEDFIKEKGATYSNSQRDCMYVTIDRHLITAQNEMSTLSAVQNLILLCNAQQGKGK